MSEGTISRGHIEFRPTGLMADARARLSAHAAIESNVSIPRAASRDWSILS